MISFYILGHWNFFSFLPLVDFERNLHWLEYRCSEYYINRHNICITVIIIIIIITQVHNIIIFNLIYAVSRIAQQIHSKSEMRVYILFMRLWDLGNCRADLIARRCMMRLFQLFVKQNTDFVICFYVNFIPRPNESFFVHSHYSQILICAITN